MAPNILMTLFSKKKHSIVIDHFQRETGELSWSITRLFKFGLKLLFDLNDYKKKDINAYVSKNTSSLEIQINNTDFV